MYSKIKIAGHPVHPMLIAFPVAFYTAAMACFIAYNGNANPFWFKAGIAANIAGVGMALLAAIPGFIDWLNIPSGQQAKKTGVVHMICNVLALILFAVNAGMLYNQWNTAQPELYYALPLTIAGFVITLIAGFYGWTLVQTHHVGVDMEGSKSDNLVTGSGRTVSADRTTEDTPQWRAAKDRRNTDSDR